MTLDHTTRELVESTVEKNVLTQLLMVVPDFFNGAYVVGKLIPKAKDKHDSSYPHVVSLEPRIFVSTHPNYDFNHQPTVDQLLNLVKNGSNLVLGSTGRNFKNGYYSDKLLETTPCYPLVVAEMEHDDISHSRVIYGSGERLFGGHKVRLSLDAEILAIGASRCDITFAFLQPTDKKRHFQYITHFAEGPRFIPR